MQIWLISIMLIALAFPCTATAALGETVESVQIDQAQMKATLRVASGDKYTVHEIQAPSGTVVREYASPSGKVFAVAWEGPRLPDLRQVLGTYFDPYVEGVKARRGGHGPVTIQEPELVVYTGGHMRAFFGKAYLPQMLPPGVSAKDIR